MRYIDLNKLKLPIGWKAKANKLLARLKVEPEGDRAKIMDDNPIWQELIVPLSLLSKGKCWYSEAKDVMSDRDVDHFRPKNKAQNVNNIPRSDEDGYWWLAYDYKNYRFSSQYSNQKRNDKFKKKKQAGGKGDFFPLFAGSPVAKKKNRCCDEQIMLLDPCDKNDPSLLTFDSKGTALPNTRAILDPDDKTRVEVSIRLYNLDHTPLVELREQVWIKCQRKIDEIRKISTSRGGLSIHDKSRIKFLKDEIIEMTSPYEEVSAVAIACCEHNGLSVLIQNI